MKYMKEKINISIETKLLARIDEQAAKERRSRSNMIEVLCVYQLEHERQLNEGSVDAKSK